MDNHSYFTEPVTTSKYSKNKYRVVCYNLQQGDSVLSCLDFNSDGKMVTKVISKIIETRLSAGVFDNHNRPNSYLVEMV